MENHAILRLSLKILDDESNIIYLILREKYFKWKKAKLVKRIEYNNIFCFSFVNSPYYIICILLRTLSDTIKVIQKISVLITSSCLNPTRYRYTAQQIMNIFYYSNWIFYIKQIQIQLLSSKNLSELGDVYFIKHRNRQNLLVN